MAQNDYTPRYIITVDGEELDHADSMGEARTRRHALIYNGVGTEDNTAIEKARAIKFTLEISLTNAQMQTGPELSEAINKYVVNQIADWDDLTIEAGLGHNIRDTNGNKVGTWRLS